MFGTVTKYFAKEGTDLSVVKTATPIISMHLNCMENISREATMSFSKHTVMIEVIIMPEM